MSASDSVETGATAVLSGAGMLIPIRGRVPLFRCRGAPLSPFRASLPLMSRRHMMIDRLTTPWWALRAALGAAAFLAGLDKFFNLLADWPGYLSRFVAAVLPVSVPTFMHAIGIVEMGVGA